MPYVHIKYLKTKRNTRNAKNYVFSYYIDVFLKFLRKKKE